MTDYLLTIINFTIMELNIKELQQLQKEGKKEFAFLTPVSDYIAEHYGEIKDELEVPHVEEILRDLRKETNFDVVMYDSLNSFVISQPSIKSIDFDKKGVDNIVFVHTRSYLNKLRGNLSELYYISDLDGYYQYLEEEEQLKALNYIKQREEQLTKLKEHEAERQAKVIEDNRLRAKFGLAREASTEKARLFESIFQNDKLDVQFEAFNKITAFDEDSIREMAYEEADSCYEGRRW
jgi:hypothetical protein